MKLRSFSFSSQIFRLRNFSFKLYSREKRKKRPAFVNAPMRRGIVKRLRIKTPRKPNSARRPVIKVKLSTARHVVSHIPGHGHNLRRYSKVLIMGVGARDLPGVHHTAVRGVFDFSGCLNKTKRRSIYGIFLPLELKNYTRRKLRK
jgi:small subunit ribosomal protein S12